MEFKLIPIEDIEFRPDNPRLTFSDESINELASSLKRDGLIEPIVVRPRGLKYELVIGERRVRAAVQANIPKIPALIREDITDEEASRLRLTENINRKDLDVFERVEGIRVHMKKFGQTLDQVSKELDKTPETIRAWFRLAEATSPKIKIVDSYVRKLGTQKLMEISKFDFETQERLAEKIIQGDLSVDQVRRFVTLFEHNPDANLDILMKKVKEQVKTIEVTLPIEEAKEVEKRAEEFRKRATKASRKLEKHLRKKQKKGTTEEKRAFMALTETLEVPVETPPLKKLWDTEIAKEVERRRLSPEEIKHLEKFKPMFPIDQIRPEESSAKAEELVNMVLKETRPQIVVLEVQPKLYIVVEAFAKSQGIFPKEAVLLLVEEGLERQGLWKSGR